MATASIESSVTAPVAKGSVIGASRDDLEINDVVLLDSVNTGTSYAWSIAFAPEGSTATFSGSAVAKSPGSFTVDQEGPYLIRLQFTDGTGTTEQFARLRALTSVGGLKLVAAGEGIGDVNVPVDATAAGWADEQNGNLLKILGLVQKAGVTGRLLYVDENQGDYQTIQSAMAYAQSQGPTSAQPWVVLARPADVYVEDLTFFPHVHLFGWPGTKSANVVKIRNASDTHAVALPLVGDELILSNLYFERTDASSDALLDLTGAGTLTVYQCALLAGGSGSPQGPAILTAGTGTLKVRQSVLSSNAAASAASYSLEVGTGTTAEVWDSQVQVRGIRAVVGSTLKVRDSVIAVTGAYGISSDATLLEMDYTEVSGGTSQDMAFNPSGAAVVGDVVAKIRWSSFDALIFDTTGITGTTSLSMGSVEHGAISLPGGSPSTLAATVPSSTLFFDNAVTGIAAGDVQAALDEIWGLATQVENLDDAYDGGGAGAGRRIVADQGAVQIVDAASPSDPIPAGNTNGGLEVVGIIKVGALTKPEITADPNPYGNGPQILLGQEIWANDAVLGSSALLLANATGAASYHNYNLRVGSSSADGGGQVGHVVLRGGDSLANPVDAASLYLQAGRGVDGGGGDGGSIYLAPGDSAGGTGGKLVIARPEDATPATIQAAGAFVGGVTGTARFATDMGAFEVGIDAADNLAAVIAKFDATNLVVATDAGGGVLLLTTVARGPMAEVFLLSADAGLDTALGVFGGQAMTQGTYPSTIAIEVSANQEITFGVGAANPMIYNAVTGKLTVPGPLDPTYLIQTNAPPTAYTSGKGTLWVGDGTGGSVLGDLYYIHEHGTSAGSAINLSTGGGGGGTINVIPETFESATFSWDGTVSSVTLSNPFNNASNLAGLLTLSRNGVHDIDNVGPAVPSNDREFRINGGGLEIGADITADGDTYRIVYPST